MESQLQNPGFRNNPENFYPCIYLVRLTLYALMESSFWQKLLVRSTSVGSNRISLSK